MKKIKGVRYPNQTQRPRFRIQYAPGDSVPPPPQAFLRGSSRDRSTLNVPSGEQRGNFVTPSSVTNVLGEISRLQSQNSNGKIEIGMLPFGWLVSQAAETDIAEQPPQDAVVENAEIRGLATSENIALELIFDVVILKEGWTQLSLASSKIAISMIEIEQVLETAVASTAPAPSEPPVVAGSSLESLPAISPDVVVAEAVIASEPCAYISVSNSYHKLYSYGAARWKVKLLGKAPYASNQNHNFSLWIPESICTKLWFTVLKADVTISVEKALEQSQVMEESKSTVTASLPPTNKVALGWIESSADIGREAAVQGQKEKVQVVVSAEQQGIVSIGEVTLSHRFIWNLTIMHGPRFAFEIEIPESLVIRNVTGSNIKSWEVVSGQRPSHASSPRSGAAVSDLQAEITPAPAPIEKTVSEATEGGLKTVASHQKERRVLRVYHQHGAEGHYQFSVFGETPLKEREGALSIQSCKMRDVERETGFLAIDAPSNVEVIEKTNPELTRIDIQELPLALQSHVTASILYAYKFMAAGWSANMDIHRHQDMDVLIAVIDEAWICSTVVMEGKVQTKMELKVRNTTRQYLRVQLPDGASIWSSEVNRNLVKPAHDPADKSVMIALEKSSGINQGKDYYWVDIVYIYQLKSMKGRGEVSMTLPSFDLPANQLFVELHLPDNFKYGEFDGDLKEVRYFGKSKHRADVEREGPRPPVPPPVPVTREPRANRRVARGGAPAGRADVISLSQAYDGELCDQEASQDDYGMLFLGGEEPSECVVSREESSSLGIAMDAKMGEERLANESTLRIPVSSPMIEMEKERSGGTPPQAPPAPPSVPASISMPIVYKSELPKPAGQGKGTKPVRVDFVTQGRLFRLERLLTDREKFSLAVPYAEIKEPFWKKRHAGRCLGLC